MGVDQTFYCGPYVECEWKGVPQTQRVHYCLGDKSHKVTGSDNFCALCGSKVEFNLFKTGIIVSDIEWEDVEEAIEEKLYEVNLTNSKQLDYYLPNTSIDGLDRPAFGKYEEGIVEISPDAIEKEIAAVEIALSSQLNNLRKLYKSVRVTWGVISYCW